MQVTKEIWHKREQCACNRLFPPPHKCLRMRLAMRKRITTLGGNREPSFLVCVGANWKQTPLPTYWLRYLCMQYSLMLHCKLVFLWSQKLLLTTANHNCSKLMEIIKKEWVSPLISESAFQISTCQLTYQQSLTSALHNGVFQYTVFSLLQIVSDTWNFSHSLQMCHSNCTHW